MLKRQFHGWCGAWLILLYGFSTVSLGNQYSDMVQGLRERQYYDYALFYLDQLAARTDLPEDVRQEIPYEKALILVDNSKQTRSPEKQLELLDQAAAFLQDFVNGAPNHAKAGDANSQRAEILLGKARVEIQQSRAPSNQGIRSEFQQRARDLITQARAVFETAQKQHEATWQSYPTYIDEDKDPDKYAAREQALMQLISAMLNVCQCRYEEAQSYDPGTPEYKKILTQAADEFEQLHQRYRNYTGGLYARLYQAKCFDDQGSQDGTQRAMGIYDELLSHDGKSNRNIRKLQHKTLQFKLEALNRKTPPDSQVVVDLAREWLDGNKGESRTQTGLSILWEQAVAYEALGDQREAGKGDKERNWRTARTQALLINKFVSPYRDVSMSMIQRLDGKLGGRERKPDSFETAQGLGNQNFRAIQDLRKELQAARDQKKPAEELQKIEQDLATEMSEATEMFQLALNLADKNDDPKAVSTARLYLAYVHFWARRNFEAAIIGQFVARTAPKDESSLAVDAAYLAMAAFVQAYNDAKGSIEQKTSELKFVIDACEFLISRWPNDGRANDARMMAGRMYLLSKQPIPAAEWFSKVPEADGRYAEAQLAAGQAYWDGYKTAARKPEAERPPLDQMKQWQGTAEQHLRTGITKMSAVLPKEGLPPPEMMGAKFSLAELLINRGQEAEAVTILTADPQSVTKAVTVADESQRPAQGVQKRSFAVEVYKLLLRAYIGNGKLDEARATMKTLEGIAAGGSAGSDVTELYVSLGKLLKDELDRFRTTDTERFNSLRTSFETFLNDVFQRKEGHSVGTLSWVGETYSALGEAAPDQAAAITYFDKSAAALQQILQLSEGNPSFATTDQLLAVRVRLAHALRMKKDYQEAEKLITQLLKERKDDLRLQIEAAHLYQDWGSEPGEEKRLLLAMRGNPENQTVGFGPLSKRMQGLMRRGKNPEIFNTYLDMRYQSSLTRLKYGQAQTDAKEKKDQLDGTELELMALARVTKDIPDEYRSKYNTLFRQVREVLADPKRPVMDLDFTTELNAEPATATAETTQEKAADEKKEAKSAPAVAKPKAEPKPESPLMTYLILGGLGLGIVGGVTVLILRKPKKKPLIRSSESQPVSFDFAGIPAAPAPAAKPKPTVAVGPPREKKVASAAGPAAATAVKKPAAPTSASAATGTAKPAVPKPRPKPPAPGTAEPKQ